MKLILFLLILFVSHYIHAMDECLNVDVCEIIKSFLLLHNEQQACFVPGDFCLSNNYTHFNLIARRATTELCNIALFHNYKKNRLELHVLMSNCDGKQETAKITYAENTVDRYCNFDGPNDNNFVIADNGYYILNNPPENSPLQENKPKAVKKKNTLKEISCWCKSPHQQSQEEKLPFVYCDNTDFGLEKELGDIKVVAVHKTTNHFVHVHHDEMHRKQTVALYVHDPEKGYEPEQIAKSEFVVTEGMGIFKKISFLTPSTLLALDGEGNVTVVAIAADDTSSHKKISLYPQRIVDEKKKLIKIKDMAVDPCHPFQMVMLFDNGQLVYGDIRKKSYLLLTRNKSINFLKYYNDTITFIDPDNCSVYSYEVRPVTQSMIKELSKKNEK